MNELDKKQNELAQPATEAELNDVSGGSLRIIPFPGKNCPKCGKNFGYYSQYDAHVATCKG